MNINEALILNSLHDAPFVNQRELAARTGLSIGLVNKALRSLRDQNFLDGNHALSAAAVSYMEARRPRRAVILAAGFGVRMIPANQEVPGALLKVRGEVLIERQIRHLRESGIREIAVVVGFMKERFEYLMDAFSVTLIVNDGCARHNNLLSLHKALRWLDNCYVLPCDFYFVSNPFRAVEMHSWYMVTDLDDPESTVRMNRKGELVFASGSTPRNGLVGLSYLTEPDASVVRQRLAMMAEDPRYSSCFWEETLREGDRMLLPARLVSHEEVFEINTCEQLREMDSGSALSRSEAVGMMAAALSSSPEQITGVSVLKKGMTNRSFLFTCRGKKYIMRIPGEGTGRLINRQQEAAVYRAIRGYNISDRVVFLDPESGCKITEFLENARVCNPANPGDMRLCIERLRGFHRLGLQVDHEFDLFGQLEFYESLRNGAPSVFPDYAVTKRNILSLRPFIEQYRKPFALTHIDAVPDNFLLTGTEIRLIDWEYAGMQDQDVDLAMFCIYALYDRAGCDALIDAYYPEGCPETTRIKIYAYIAVCGLLWSNWCEYRRSLGVEFGEYALRQYRYAKDFFRIVRQYLEEV